MKLSPTGSADKWLGAAVMAPAVLGSVCAILLLARRRGFQIRSLTGKSALDVVGRFGSPTASVRLDHAETWYYRPSGGSRWALAVLFDRGVVTDVQWIRPPA